jgi:lysophospholipase L1-like esterase
VRDLLSFKGKIGLQKGQYMPKRKTILKVYFVLLHLLIIVILLKSDFILRVENKLGLTKQQSEISEHYKRMIIYHSWIDGCVPNEAIIFIGDSITQGLCVTAISGKGVNFGIGGDTTAGVLKRINSYNCIKSAKAIVMAIGINDLFKRQNNEILDNYKKIISEMPKDIPLIISAILPVDENIFHKRLNKRVTDLNDGIKNLCSTTDNCYFINSGSELVNDKGNLDNKYHVGDGIHLNQSGYRIWINDLKEILNKVAYKN